MAPVTVAEVVERLRRGGVRVTAPRRAVVEALVALGSHATAEQLHEHVQRHRPEVSITSVYRTMEVLARLGVVTHVHIGHGPAEYHLAHERHAHLVCDGCGTVTEVPDELVAPFAQQVADHVGFELDVQHFALTGRCPRCARFDRDGPGQEG